MMLDTSTPYTRCLSQGVSANRASFTVRLFTFDEAQDASAVMLDGFAAKKEQSCSLETLTNKFTLGDML